MLLSLHFIVLSAGDDLAGRLTTCPLSVVWTSSPAGLRSGQNVRLFARPVWCGGPGVRSDPGRPAAWRPASSSSGLVPTGGPPVRSSELEEKEETDATKVIGVFWFGLTRGRIKTK